MLQFIFRPQEAFYTTFEERMASVWSYFTDLQRSWTFTHAHLQTNDYHNMPTGEPVRNRCSCRLVMFQSTTFQNTHDLMQCFSKKFLARLSRRNREKSCCRNSPCLCWIFIILLSEGFPHQTLNKNLANCHLSIQSWSKYQGACKTWSWCSKYRTVKMIYRISKYTTFMISNVLVSELQCYKTVKLQTALETCSVLIDVLISL